MDSVQLKSPDRQKETRASGKPARALGNISNADDGEGLPSTSDCQKPHRLARSEGGCAAWLAAIRDDPAITPAALRMAHVVAQHMTPGIEAAPRLAMLARDSNRTVRSVHTNLKILRERGWITRVGDQPMHPGKSHVHLMTFPEVQS